MTTPLYRDEVRAEIGRLRARSHREHWNQATATRELAACQARAHELDIEDQRLLGGALVRFATTSRWPR